MPMKFNFDSIMAPLGKPMSIGGVGGGQADSRIEGGFMPQPAFDPSNLQSQIGGLQEQIGNISQFDDSSLRKMIEANAGRPGFDSSQLESQIGGLQDQFSNMPQFDDSNLRQMIEQNANRPQFDASGLQSQIGGLQDQFSNMPQFDDSQLQSQIGGLQDQFSNMPQFDPSQLQQGISGLEDRFSNLSQFNPSALQDRLNTLEGRELPQFDPSDLQSGIAGLQDQFSNMPQFDPSQLQNRLNTLEGRELPKFNPQDYRDDFLSIAREGVQMPDFKAPDLSGYAKKEDLPSFDRQKLIEDIRGQINIPQAPDFSAYDTRFEDMQKRIDELTQNQIPQAPQAPQPIPMLPNETSVPFLPPMAPPINKRGEFESITQDPNERLREDSNDSGRFTRGLIQAPIESGGQPGGQPVIDRGITGIANQRLNENVVGDDFNNRQPFLRAPEQGRPERFSVNQLNNQDQQPIGRLLPPEMTEAEKQQFFEMQRQRDQLQGNFGSDMRGNRPNDFARGPRTADFQDYNGDGTDDRDQQRPNVGELPNPSDLFGGIPGEPEPINFGQPPVNPGTAPVPPPATNGMPPVPGGLMDPADLEVNPGVTTDPATTGGVQERPNMVDPVLQNQTTSETISDPLLRQLYFGTEDTPGFYNQLQQAGANLIGTDVPLQDTAGLDPLQSLARQQAQEGLGQFQPYFDQQQGLVNEAIGQSRRAEDLQDPYFNTAEQQIGLGLDDSLGGIGEARNLSRGTTGDLSNRLGDIESQAAGNVGQFGQALGGIGGMAMGATDEFGNRLGESEDLLRGTLGGYDQNMTSQFYNPYEDAVVNQTIQDVMDAGDKQDISARAQGISSGGESAFGSRARLGADERREALGRGLGKALSGIRSQGFQQAQQTGMSEFARQKAAQSAAASGLGQFAGSRLGANQQLGGTLRGLSSDQLAAQQGLTNQLTSGAQSRYGAGSNLASNLQQYGQGSSAARQNMASGMLGIGQQRGAGANALGSNLAAYGNQMGNIGSNVEQLRRGQRSELSGMGMDNRSISEQENQRRYQQQLSQQLRPLQTVQGIGALLPGYQASSTNIGSQYGMADDPTAKGLGAAFSAYGSLAPRSS